MKKRIIAMLAALMLLLGIIPVGAAAATELADIYVATTGLDTNAGTEDAPVLSLNQALELVKNGGTIHIVDSFTAEAGFVWQSHNKDVTITGGRLDLSASYTEEADGDTTTRQCFYQGDAVTYDNIELVVAEGGFYFANGNRLQVNETVTITGGMKLFGGSYKKNVATTDVKLLGGDYLSIYGGGYKGYVTGDVNLYVGNVNADYSVTHDGSTLLYGGGYNCNVYGDINLVIAAGNVDYAYGSSHNSGTVSGNVNVLMSGGNLYSLYGGGSGTIKGDINLSMTGGTVAQLFGANKKLTYTGNVSVMLKGGTLTRRFFGGCYNDYNLLGYIEDTYVSGNIDVYLYEGMNLNWNTEETDIGFFVHSRHDPLFDEEVTTLYYMDTAAQTKHAGNVGAQNSTMSSAMGSAAVADNVSVYDMTTKAEKWNIILGDDIGARFYMDIPEVVADMSQVKVTVADKTETIDLSKCTPNNLGQYLISVNVAAAQMTENITLQLVIDGAECEAVSYTVAGYAQEILSGDYDPEMQTLVQHLLNYGAAAQQYFDINTGNLANAGYELDYTAQLPEGYDSIEANGKLSGVKFYGATLVFENQIALRYYFTADSIEGVTFTANGENYTAKEKNGMYYVEVPGINPQEYATSITLSAVKGEETLEVSYSPMHYIVRMSSKGSDALKALVGAMYGYYEAAFDYVEEDENLSDVVDWTSTDSLPNEAGKYRLTAPVNVAAATTTAKYAEIYLDLNGQTVTGTNNNRIYVVDEGSNLTITDTSSGAGTILCNRESTADAGAIYVKGVNAVFNLEGGIIDASGVSVNAGAAVYVAAGATFNMTDGTITGGTATGNGGNVYVQGSTNDVSTSGTLSMTGGMITLGTAAQGGNVYVAAGSDTKLAATFNMNGGIISDGEATTTAGNVAALGVFAMTDGIIADGVCAVSGNHKYAANLYTLPGKNGCSFTMTGGTITGGVRVNNAGTIYLGGTAKIVGGTTNLTFSAGTMETTGLTEGAEISVNHTTYGVENSFGTAGVEGDEKFIITDKGKFVSATEDGKLYAENITKWTSTTSLPTKAGSYRLSAPVSLAKAASTATEAEIYLDLNGYTVTGTDGNRIYVVNESAKLTIDDTATGGKIVCVRENTEAVAGAIYLKGAGAEFNLNGGTIDVSGVTVQHGAAVYVAAGTTFTMNGGTITGGTASETGGNIYVQAGVTAGVFNMNGGTVMGGYAKQGGNIYVAAGSDTNAAAVFNMNGGAVTGGEGTATAGNVAALGVFSMTDGTISGGICNVTGNHKYAANLYTLPGKAGCTFTMTGGTIQGGVRVNNAGVITLGGTAKIVGGTYNLTFSAGTMETTGFSDGAEISVNHTAYGTENSFGTIGAAGDEQYIKADDRSIVAVTEDGKLYLEEVTVWESTDSLPTTSGYYRLTAPVNVSAATTTAQNTNIYLDLNGQTITGSNNTRIYVLNIGAKLTIDDTANGGKIVCVRENTGDAGAIYVKSEGAVFTLKNGTIDASGVNVKSGAAVYVAAGTTFNMNGGTIIGGTVTGNGGSVYVSAATNDVATAGTFTMNGGTVTGGSAVQGGNIYVAAGSSTKAAAEFHMNGGTVSAGEASTTGGNVAALGVFNMIGGTVTGGVCKATTDHKYATNIYTLPGKNGCTFTMIGGEIVGGVRVNNAGTITLGGTAKITTDSNGYGMYVSTNGATIVVDEAKPLATGAEIWLSETGNDPIVAGVIDAQYQEFFKYCGSGTLSFDENGIHVEALVIAESNEAVLVAKKKQSL